MRDILQQIAACRGSINGLMSEVLEGHIRFHLVEREPKRKSHRGQCRRRSDHYREVLFEVARKPCQLQGKIGRCPGRPNRPIKLIARPARASSTGA